MYSIDSWNTVLDFFNGPEATISFAFKSLGWPETGQVKYQRATDSAFPYRAAMKMQEHMQSRGFRTTTIAEMKRSPGYYFIQVEMRKL